MAIQRKTIEIRPQAGWSSDFSKSGQSSVATKQGTYYKGLVNPFKPNKIGQFSNAFGENPTKMTFALSEGYAINATAGSNNKGYTITQKGIITEFDLTYWSNTKTNFTEPAGCLFDNYKDMWKHVEPTTGTEAVFFTYQTASNAYVGYARVGAIATRSNTYYTLGSRNVPHVGCVSVRNQSYVTDGRYLRAYNPDTGTWSSLDCGSGIVLYSVCDYGNYVVAVGSNGLTSWAFFWDGTSLGINYKYDIRDTNTTAVINEGGDIRVFTYGKNGTTKIKTFSNGFSEEADFEVDTSYCSSPLHGQVDVWMNQIVWKSSQTVSGTTTDGYIWTFGSPLKSQIVSGAHRVGKVSTDTNTTGCVKNLYGNALYVGIADTSLAYLYQVKADESYASTVDSQIVTNKIEVPRNANIDRVQFFFSDYAVPGNSSSGSSLELNIYANNNSTPSATESIPTFTDVAGTTQISWFPFTKVVPELDLFYLDVTYGGVVSITKIVVTISYETGDL